MSTPAAPMEEKLLFKIGEVALKGDNRPFFDRVLVSNLTRVLERRGEWKLSVIDRRLYASASGTVDVEGSIRACQKVFGLTGIARAHAVRKDWEEVRQAAFAVADHALAAAGGRGLTFKVEARRVDKHFPKRSIEMNRELGADLLARQPLLRVDVHHPELTVNVEIRFEGAYVYGQTLEGPGGLPVGSSGRALVLLSGGIDSPVAAWYALKRGLEADAIHFHTPGFTTPESVVKVRELCAILSTWGGPARLHLVNFAPLHQLLIASAPPDMRVTLMRRMFVRIACRVAGETFAVALVTGESLGQVASQTIQSLAAIERVSDRPILRPLVGFDKAEIVTKARAIGTYETSIQPFEDCCALIVARHPETRPTKERLERAEAELACETEIEKAWREREIVPIGQGANLGGDR